MFKPNIRGYPRSKLRPGTTGWHASNLAGDQVRIQYRSPWRENWLIKVETNLDLAVVQARSGQVHLLNTNSKRSSQNIPAAKWKTLRIPIVAILFLALGWLASAGPSDDVQSESKYRQAQILTNERDVKTCGETNFVSIPELEDLLNGSPSSLNLIDQDSDVRLGGLLSRTVRLGCADKQANVRLQFRLGANSWKLTKATRLEN